MVEALAEIPHQAGFDPASRGTTRGAKKNHPARLETNRGGVFIHGTVSEGLLRE